MYELCMSYAWSYATSYAWLKTIKHYKTRGFVPFVIWSYVFLLGFVDLVSFF